MRALAVMAVMVFHASHDWLSGGFLGVEVFFVISGYLITLLLIGEHERTGFISLRAFWGRRFRRLLPALYLTLVLVVAYCALFLRDPLGKVRGDVVGAVFYVSNWYQIWTGQGYAALADFVPLRHLWSLGVEEQFYLVWPLIMILLLRGGRERLPKIGLCLIALSIAITAATAVFFHSGFYNSSAAEFPNAYFEVFGRLVEKNNFLYLGTFSRSSGIMLGAGFAMLWRPLAVMRGPLREKGRVLDVWAVLGLVGLAALVFKYELFDSFTGTYFSLLFRGGFLLTGLCTIAIIAAVTHPGSMVGRFLGNKVLNWIGTRSYGLYLFHWPIYQMIRKQAGVALTFPKFAMAIAITVVIAEGSYRFVEMPVRKREFFSQFSATPRVMVAVGAVGLLVSYSGVSLLTADVKCTSKIECDSAAAHQAAAQTTALTPVTATTGVTAPTATTVFDATSTTPLAVPGLSTIPGESTTTVAATTTIAVKPVIDDLAIGESVMQGVQNVLPDHGVLVDAQESIQGKGIIEAIKTARSQYDITGAVIIQSGTNGPVSQADYDEMATLLADLPHVYFLTIKAPLKWVDPNNAIITALPVKHPNVTIIDWHALGTQLPPTDLSKVDGGIHLNSSKAVRFYANMILGALGKPLIPTP